MKKKLAHNNLVVKKSPMHGYGVFAGKALRKGEIIEECYVIITNGKDDILEDYYFDANGKDAILTGYGIIYNHCDDDNAEYTLNIKRKLATFKAIRPIKKGEEIFVSYGDEWFSSRGKRAKTHKRTKPVVKKRKRAKR